MSAVAQQYQSSKPPLSHEVLTDVIDLSLFAGQLLLQFGAEASRIEETVHHIGTGLGCDWMDIIVAADGITISAISGKEFRTKLRRVTRSTVNLSIIHIVNDLSRRVFAGEIDRHELRIALVQAAHLPPVYNRWLVIVMVGSGCAAFGRLFGGDLPVLAVTFVAASIAMFVRQELIRRNFNLFLVVVITAFIAGLLASTATTWSLSDTPDLAIAASVLLLVPGVPLINAAEDLLQGYTSPGIARGVAGGIVTLGIASGLALAMVVMGVDQLWTS